MEAEALTPTGRTHGFGLERTAGIFLYPYWGVPGVDEVVRKRWLVRAPIGPALPTRASHHCRNVNSNNDHSQGTGTVVFVSLMLIYGRLWNGSTTATSIGAKWCLLYESIVSSCRRVVAAMAISAKPGE
jgi:hypothetical protein